MISRSSLILAGRRALAFDQKNELFKDQYAQLFISEEIYDFVKRTDEEIHGMLLRTRYIEDLLIENIDRIDCVLSLGSGFDTKFQRIEKLSHHPYIEFDRKELLEFKHRLLKCHDLPTPEYYFSENMDFQNLAGVISLLSPQATPFIFAEGFFMYWPKEILTRFIDFIDDYFAHDIYFVFDHHCERISQMKKSSDIQLRLKTHGEHMFSTYNPDEIITYLKEKSFESIIQRPRELCQRYLNKEWRDHNEKYTCLSIRHS